MRRHVDAGSRRQQRDPPHPGSRAAHLYAARIPGEGRDAGGHGERLLTVHFIGAGPGAPDLITERGLRLIERCPVCLYAGSLVPTEIVAAAPAGARVVDTAPL